MSANQGCYGQGLQTSNENLDLQELEIETFEKNVYDFTVSANDVTVLPGLRG